MSKKTLGQKLIKGMNQAIEYTQGQENGARAHIPEHIDVQKIRRGLDLTQEAFSLRYGFAITTLRNWEQGIREPTGPARVLLMLLKKDPKGVEKIIQRVINEDIREHNL